MIFSGPFNSTLILIYPQPLLHCSGRAKRP